MPTLPEARVGEPIRHEALSAFPLFTRGDGAVEYLLADEAIAAGAVTVEEVGESGSVPDLLVENEGIPASCSSRGRSCAGPSRTGS